jgi:uncharacterized protein (TIGR02147 family)
MFYTDLLKQEFAVRRLKNPSFSERAFARYLGLSPGFLKLIFQGKKRLSPSRANEVASRLEWSELKKNGTRTPVSHVRFEEISDWYHFAILELLKTQRRAIPASKIAARLGLSLPEVEYAIALLADRNLLSRLPKSRVRIVDHYEVPSMSSLSVRKYHRQTMTKAHQSIDGQKPDQRELGGLSIAFDSKRIAEAKTVIQKFLKDFDDRFAIGNKDSVYHLTMAFFRLDEGEP